MYRSATKKFYGNVSVEPGEHGYAVLLDGRPVKTPAGAELAVPGKALAEAIAGEWSAQEESIDPQNMRLTALACTMIDRIGAEREGIENRLLEYVETDLVCYRVPEPTDLAARQHEAWQPLVDWLAESYRAELVITEAILPVSQSRQALETLSKAIADLADWELAALSSATVAAGSLVVGLALIKGRIGADEAFAIAQLDETYQNEKWGTVTEAARRQGGLQKDFRAAAAFVELFRL